MSTDKELFLRHVAQTSPRPIGLSVDHAKGIYITTIEGKKYIDMVSGVCVSNLGHGHPSVIEAINKQTAAYLHTMVYGEYIQAPQVKLAQMLSGRTGDRLNSVYFVNSGSEAVEGALKLAKRFTGCSEVITFENAYHGSTHGALSVLGHEKLKQAFRPLVPGTQILPFGDESALERISEQTACVIIEPIQGEAGVRIPSVGFMKKLRAVCSETNTLLVVDEIQTGFGRTGDFFAFEQFDIQPDILLLAKALGGGLPLGAFISSGKIMSTLTHNPALGHITTFGGNPVCCAAGIAVIETIEAEKLLEHAKKMAKVFQQHLSHHRIKAIRQSGLMIALEFESAAFNNKVIANCFDLGLITESFLFADNCLRISPPLVITEIECMVVIDKLLQAIDLAS